MGTPAPDPDIERLPDSIARSPFRARFRLGEADRRYIAEKELETVRRHARDFVTARIAPAHPRNDGRQTPLRGHPVFVAQHATATCCRGCIERHHGIAKGAPLSTGEIDRLVNIVMRWIEREYERKA